MFQTTNQIHACMMTQIGHPFTITSPHHPTCARCPVQIQVVGEKEGVKAAGSSWPWWQPTRKRKLWGILRNVDDFGWILGTACRNMVVPWEMKLNENDSLLKIADFCGASHGDDSRNPTRSYQVLRLRVVIHPTMDFCDHPKIWLSNLTFLQGTYTVSTYIIVYTIYL